MNKLLARCVYAIGLVVLIASSSQAGAITYEAPLNPAQNTVFYGDANYTYTAAAERFFVGPGGATINGAQWWGGCNDVAQNHDADADPDFQSPPSGSGPQNCPGAGFNFILTFYNHDSINDQPGTLASGPYSFNVSATNQTATGNLIGGLNDYITEYQYSVAFGVPFFLAEGTYWLGISSDVAGSPNLTWGWESAAGEDTHAQLSAGAWQTFSDNLAFSLTEAGNNGSAAVPEPASLSLLAFGAAGLALRRRRQKK